MKKEKIKSILIIALVSLLLIILTGCGTTKEKNEEIQSNQNNEQKKQEQEQESTTTQVAPFVKYKEATYFWKLSANSRESTGLFAKYAYKTNNKNELVKLDNSGNETTILTEKGSGDICISNDKIFLRYPEDEYGNIYKIYSVNMNGENKKEYQEGELKASIKDFVICQNSSDGEIFEINAKTDEIVMLKENANVLDVIDDVIYYYEEDSKTGILKVGTIKDNKDNGTIATFSKKDLFEEATDESMEIVEFGEQNGKLKIYIGYRAGTAHMLQDEYCFTMNKDGSNLEKQEVTSLEIVSEDSQKLKGVYIDVKEENGKYTNNLVYIDDSTKERKEILTEKQMNEKFKFTSDDEHTVELAESAIVENDIYVVLDYGVHNSEEDIGWRYSYKRLKTVCFKYNIDTKEITEIFEF
ncbi:MAG: DUF5050 domain-containing protein [Clostridia bacterium]|nr:DUF5050 domain-containing protein [Clostridia bacterium]